MPNPAVAPLTPEEIQEAQRLGIIPGPQNRMGPALPRALAAGLESGARALPPGAGAPQVPPSDRMLPPRLDVPQTVQAPVPAPQSAPTANVGQISAPVQPNPAPLSSPVPQAPQRVAPRGPAVVPRVQLDPATAPTSPLSQSLAAQREKYNTQLDRLMAPPDYGQLSQQMRNRAAGGMDDMYAAVLAGIGPEAVRGMQEPLLKKSLAAQAPMSI